MATKIKVMTGPEYKKANPKLFPKKAEKAEKVEDKK